MQLGLFTWETERIGEASKHLVALDFEQAISIFKEVLAQDPENEKAITGAITANHWNKIFDQCDGFEDIDALESFYMEIQDFDYDKDSTGKLEATGSEIDVPSPVCVRFMETDRKS